MPKYVVIAPGVTRGKSDYAVGDVIFLTEKWAKSLLEAAKIREFDPTRDTDPNAEPEVSESARSTEDSSSDNTQDTAPPATAAAAVADLTDDQRAQLADSLDKAYTAEELKEKAKAMDIQFKYDVKKADLIEIIIDSGKANTLLTAATAE